MSPGPRARSRLQKFLSDAGVASRRAAEEWILAGRVLVNDRIVDTLPAFVDPDQDHVVVDGAPVRPRRLDYFLVHKPKGVVCTNRDPSGRVRAIDLLPDLRVRLFPVGRLDADSTGLLLMTNDGRLAERITHPRFGIPKTYRAEVRGQVPNDLPAQMKKGVHLAEGKAQVGAVEIVHTSRQRSVLMITLREGRNRQVRRMLARLGYPVRTLKRVQIGPLSIRGLPLGAARRLTPKELAALRKELETGVGAPSSTGRPRGLSTPRWQPKRTPSLASTKSIRRKATATAPKKATRPKGTPASGRGTKPAPKRRLIT